MASRQHRSSTTTKSSTKVVAGLVKIAHTAIQCSSSLSEESKIQTSSPKPQHNAQKQQDTGGNSTQGEKANQSTRATGQHRRRRSLLNNQHSSRAHGLSASRCQERQYVSTAHRKKHKTQNNPPGQEDTAPPHAREPCTEKEGKTRNTIFPL